MRGTSSRHHAVPVPPAFGKLLFASIVLSLLLLTYGPRSHSAKLALASSSNTIALVARRFQTEPVSGLHQALALNPTIRSSFGPL